MPKATLTCLPLRGCPPMIALAWAIGLTPAVAFAQASPRPLELSIQKLTEVQSTSASRRPKPLSGAAAVLFVINAENMGRSVDLVGRNLLNGSHAEFSPKARIERAVYLNVERRC